MNRKFTNLIRYFMDEWIPPAIRDSKWFMYPFYWYAYKGKNLKSVMDFKSNAYKMSKEEFSDFYTKRDTRFSNSRPTDLSQKCIDFMFDQIGNTDQSLLDVGCGSGYFLEQAAKKGFATTGCDVIKGLKYEHSNYVQANVESLPLDDNSFDIVTCSHTLEHVIDFETSINELKRVAKKLLIVVVPCQRSFYYTLDEHVRFFPYKGALEQAMKMQNFKCEKIWGDLVFIGKIENN
ncbi:class I SAM-dependent methyltransferase [Fulvivirga lutea]|uniref:Class I SAM-dependent methyltransferase n=1 Tax=Fulvivirga lutea TaxID=2810512 RepID=A0A974WKH3_9BACT|nr:class I SAM-dependent methyltransferase [Fulvivirga lutea]QSE97820.1 class I SAM-dependent methyltransferase [Fulvivirga lutea]